MSFDGGKTRYYATKSGRPRKVRSKVTYGKYFRTRRGRFGRYKYINGRKVSFVAAKRRRYKRRRY